jgi:hypothetical protein
MHDASFYYRRFSGFVLNIHRTRGQAPSHIPLFRGKLVAAVLFSRLEQRCLNLEYEHRFAAVRPAQILFPAA